MARTLRINSRMLRSKNQALFQGVPKVDTQLLLAQDQSKMNAKVDQDAPATDPTVFVVRATTCRQRLLLHCARRLFYLPNHFQFLGHLFVLCRLRTASTASTVSRTASPAKRKMKMVLGVMSSTKSPRRTSRCFRWILQSPARLDVQPSSAQHSEISTSLWKGNDARALWRTFASTGAFSVSFWMQEKFMNDSRGTTCRSPN